jgi:hypothetical protein
MTNGKKDSTVFGKGFVMSLGNTTRIIRIINGYIESGRTRVPPPIPSGKKGKLLIGRAIKNSIQQILEIVPIISAPFVELIIWLIDTLCG